MSKHVEKGKFVKEGTSKATPIRKTGGRKRSIIKRALRRVKISQRGRATGRERRSKTEEEDKKNP